MESTVSPPVIWRVSSVLLDQWPAGPEPAPVAPSVPQIVSRMRPKRAATDRFWTSLHFWPCHSNCLWKQIISNRFLDLDDVICVVII